MIKNQAVVKSLCQLYSDFSGSMNYGHVPLCPATVTPCVFGSKLNILGGVGVGFIGFLFFGFFCVCHLPSKHWVCERLRAYLKLWSESSLFSLHLSSLWSHTEMFFSLAFPVPFCLSSFLLHVFFLSSDPVPPLLLVRGEQTIAGHFYLSATPFPLQSFVL